MVKKSTVQKALSLLQLIQQSGLTVNAYFKSLDKSPNAFYKTITKIRKDQDSGIEGIDEVLSLYDNLTHRENLIKDFEDNQLTLNFEESEEQVDEEVNEEEVLDTEERVESSILRNNDGKIVGYKFKVFRRDNTPVIGVLSRDEMQLIYRLYSYYGASITQREISRNFPNYSLVDFKRILRAFNITKASGPFAPHMYEEKTEDELKEIHLREKENDFLKKIEKDELKDLQNTATKLARKNRELEQTIESLSSNITVNVDGDILSIPEHGEDSDKSMILYLADMHIGARCESNTLYPNPYGYKEVKRRLEELVKCISSYGHLDELVICLMGDSLDGMDNQTARRDHYMPQNMDNMEQVSVFLDVMVNFINNCRNIANKITVYSVKCGNHGGMWEFTANIALKNVIEKYFPDIEFTLFADFFGYFHFKEHCYVLCHGKDEKFMKRPLPLNLDDRTKVMLHEWITSQDLNHYDNIHIVKGDLHSNALNSCLAFDYRNVLSLFGASDYSNYNFSRNSYGASYDLFIGNVRTLGTFENI